MNARTKPTNAQLIEQLAEAQKQLVLQSELTDHARAEAEAAAEAAVKAEAEAAAERKILIDSIYSRVGTGKSKAADLRKLNCSEAEINAAPDVKKPEQVNAQLQAVIGCVNSYEPVNFGATKTDRDTEVFRIYRKFGYAGSNSSSLNIWADFVRVLIKRRETADQLQATIVKLESMLTPEQTAEYTGIPLEEKPTS